MAPVRGRGGRYSWWAAGRVGAGGADRLEDEDLEGSIMDGDGGRWCGGVAPAADRRSPRRGRGHGRARRACGCGQLALTSQPHRKRMLLQVFEPIFFSLIHQKTFSLHKMHACNQCSNKRKGKTCTESSSPFHAQLSAWKGTGTSLGATIWSGPMNQN